MNEVRAVLLTDIVDSTGLWQTLGDEAATALWARHDRLARDLLPAWRGREVDKSDGLLLLFASAADAVGYVLAYHRALAERCSPMKARSGLHVGPVVLRDNSAEDIARGAKPLEVEGRTKVIAARIMSIAGRRADARHRGGGCRAGRARLPRAVARALAPAGHPQPLELIEVGDAETIFVPPADGAKVYRVARQGDLWLPTRHIRHGLPAERDAFIGRGDAIDELGSPAAGRRAPRQHPRHGRRRQDATGDAVRLGLARRLPPRRRLVLRPVRGDRHRRRRPRGGPCPRRSARPRRSGGAARPRHRRARPCLVILDNFEQVARHAEQTVGRWLEAAPEAAFIVTTREVLGIAGEQIMALPTLPPKDAIELFTRRRAAAKHDFAPSAEDQRVIETLTELLDRCRWRSSWPRRARA
jgi:class 3 adenylate cyclase